MKYFYYILLALLPLCSFNAGAQTVVKMPLPPQSEQALEVDVLFDEALPVGIPSAIGIMGYDITGGFAPFSYSWLEDDNVLLQGEAIIFTPQTGKDYTLQITDQNNCSVQIPIDVSDNIQSSLSDPVNPKFYVKLTAGSLYMKPASGFEGEIELSLINMKGQHVLNRTVSGETRISVNLPEGVYILQLMTRDSQEVTKHLIH